MKWETAKANLLFYVYDGVRLSPLGTAATTDLLYQPQMIDDCGAICGMRVGRGTEVPGENLPQCHSVHYKLKKKARSSVVG
jgi:hypothetical protein